MTSLRQDLRYAFRALRRTPGFTLAAILTLALGIGATTTIFTVVNGVLLRPLPYPHADRLANIWNDFGEGAQSLPAVSPLDFRDYQQRSRTFETFAAASAANVVGLRGNLTGAGEPERVDLATVTANFFPLFGVTPAYGRNFIAEEEAPNGPHVVMLSERLWRRRYGADPRLVGTTIQVDGVGHTVVGILPPAFRLALPAEAFLLTDAELWAPLQFDYGDAPPRNFTFFTVFGRLRPDVTFAQAQAEMNGIALQFRKEFPEHAGTNVRIRAVPLQEDVVKHARPALLVLLGAVALVLVIACANVAHLLLVRATVREGEFALRTALGASRWAVARQLLTESAVLAVAGGGLGLLVTTLALGLLRALHPSNLPRLGEIDVDGRVLAFTVLTCLVTTLTFGLAPALQAARNEPHRALQAGGRSGTSKARQRVRSLLILGEVALSVVLLVGAGLLVRSFVALQQVQPGFDASDVLTFQLALPASRYPKPDTRRTFVRELERRLGELPDARRVGITSKLPLTGSGSLSPYAFDEATARNWESVTADGRQVSPDYFAAMNTRVLAGRPFTWDDAAGKPQVIVIDETLARQAWPGQSAVGKQLQIGPTGEADNMAEVVGVVEHQRSHDLTRAVRPHIYFSMGQQLPVVRPRRRGDRSCARDGQGLGGDADGADDGLRVGGDGAGPLQPPADGGAGRDCAAAGGGRNLRRHRLHRDPAHARVRHPAGAGGGSSADPSGRHPARHESGRAEHPRRPRVLASAQAVPGRLAVPGEPARSPDARRHRRSADAGCPRRLLSAGPARDRGGSRDHAPERMMD